MPYKDKEVAKQKSHERYLKNRDKILSEHRDIKFKDPEKWKKILERQKVSHKKHYEKHKEKIKKQRQKNHIKNKLKREYNLTIEEYFNIYIKQMGVCAICGKKDNSKTKNNLPLVIDHCHTTNRVRGLLCNTCNILLGMAHDDISILENSIKYLR